MNTSGPSDPKAERVFALVEFKGRRVEVHSNPDDLQLKAGEPVVVEVERGWDIGRILLSESTDARRRRELPLHGILRRPTPEELTSQQQLQSEDGPALRKVKERVGHFGLPMHMIDAEHQADGNRVTFYFTAEHRVDFRSLVRDLAGIFRTRIELRQIGTREAARRLGGLGACGREICCGSVLCGFEHVTLQMARAQRLVFNPARLSGICGRLLCCLCYELPGAEGAGCRANECPAGAAVMASDEKLDEKLDGKLDETLDAVVAESETFDDP